jgi:hypothetical protein
VLLSRLLSAPSSGLVPSGNTTLLLDPQAALAG